MPVNKAPLGMNARNYLYIYPYNTGEAKRRADDKLATKSMLLKNGIATPAMYAQFENRKQIQEFDWSSLPERGFVIKPARGYAGGGIIAFRKFKNGIATSVVGEQYTIDQIQSHAFDVLDGGFSLQYLPDKCFIEERLVPYPMFRKLGAIGVPDIRVIVFHHIPVMAMLRFPTEESGGKANLSLGAIAFGIDMRTGITTAAYSKKGMVKVIPSTKVKTRGIKIPNWDQILLLAARTQQASGLGYAGIDVVLDREGNPNILEVNARPGLAIQNANLDSLRTRLERIENIPIPSPERGVEVAKSLFAQAFSEKVQPETKILTVIQPVTVSWGNRSIQVEAKLDTGAYRTSIDRRLVNELGLPYTGETVHVTSASGQGERPLVRANILLSGRKINSLASVTDRRKMKFPVIIGRKDLGGFLIKPVLWNNYSDNDQEELSGYTS
ncbi:MAG: aspartyl protease family protein [Patescibacteria group bacterium]|nr:aspartyl protease family protein [Patescibacteria group bacterium]